MTDKKLYRVICEVTFMVEEDEPRAIISGYEMMDWLQLVAGNNPTSPQYWDFGCVQVKEAVDAEY